jgi:hypothetical protein
MEGLWARGKSRDITPLYVSWRSGGKKDSAAFPRPVDPAFSQLASSGGRGGLIPYAGGLFEEISFGGRTRPTRRSHQQLKDKGSGGRGTCSLP